MGAAPWTVAGYVGIYAVSVTIAAARETLTVGLMLAVALIALLLAFVWRGNRGAWSILAVTTLAIVASQPFSPSTWWALALNLVGLVLLLAPPTRRYVWGPDGPRWLRASVVAGSVGHPGEPSR